MPIRLRRAARPALIRLGTLILPLLLTLISLPLHLVTADEDYATWYGVPFHGRVMANGQRYDMNDPTTTASNRYPFGTWLRVTNPANGKSVTVQVRDRGAFTHVVDLSYAAFAAIEDPKKMRVRVTYEVVGAPEQSATPPPAPEPSPAASPVPPAAPAPAPAPAPVPAPAHAPAPEVKPTPAAKPQSSREHVVAAGDTLFGIARRFGVALADLVRINNISNPDKVAVGQRLVFDQNASADQRSIPPQGPSTRSGLPTDPVPGTAAHIVLPGETLLDIATAYNLTPAELVELNGLSDPDHLVIGQELRIRSQSAPAAESPAPTQSDQTMEYTVQEGETLWDIALKLGVAPDALAELNGLSSPDLLTIGQSLRVAAPSNAAVTVPSSPAPAPAAPPASSRPYVVQNGDTLSSIAVRFDTTIAELLALNGLSNPDSLQPGQILSLP